MRVVYQRRCLILLLPLAVGLVLLNLTDFFVFLHDFQQQQQEHNYARNQQLLKSITAACSKQQETFIYLDPTTRRVVVTKDWDKSRCPLIDIALGSGERGVGMCTDAALYLVHSDARLIPRAVLANPEYDAWCGNRTARMFLETMYDDFVSKQPGVRHLMQVNSEHLFLRDAGLHSLMDTFLCKTHFCQHLMQQHIQAVGLRARSIYMAHSSIDFSVGGPQRASKDYNQFLHIKGKSGLKHTMQLLSCWRWHPGFPTLTVIGQFKYDEYKEFLHVPNIHFMPRPTPNDTETELVSFDSIQAAMNNIGVHICVSEREGFGHYLNEARALSALVITTDHPPMNEMVQHEAGVLVRPYRVNSYADLQLLAPYGDINAFVSPFDICGGIVETLEMPLRRRRQLGRHARMEYLAQRRDFLHQVQELSLELETYRREAQAAPPQLPRKPLVAAQLQERIDEVAAAKRKEAERLEAERAAALAALERRAAEAADQAAGVGKVKGQEQQGQEQQEQAQQQVKEQQQEAKAEQQEAGQQEGLPKQQARKRRRQRPAGGDSQGGQGAQGGGDPARH